MAAVIATAPKIIGEARKIYESVSDRRRTRETVSDTDDQESPSILRERIANLQERVDALESSEFDQADLAS